MSGSCPYANTTKRTPAAALSSAPHVAGAVTGEIHLPDGTEMVMPGDNLTITVELINKVAMSQGLRFAIREGGRTVGAGQITEIIS